MIPVDVSRRQVLVAALALGAVSAVGVAGTGALAADPWEQLTADTLRTNLGRTYTFDFGGRSFPLVLQAIDGLNGQQPRALAFRARFTGPAPETFGGEVGVLRGPGQAPVEILLTGSEEGTWNLIRNSEVWA